MVLVTSDTFFVQRLDASACGGFVCSRGSCAYLGVCAGSIKEEFRSSFVLGNLGREEAHAFFFGYVVPFFKNMPPQEPDTWDRVHSVCGGNPGLLRKCATEVSALGSWEKGVRGDCGAAGAQLAAAVDTLACSQAARPSFKPPWKASPRPSCRRRGLAPPGARTIAARL